MPPGWILGTATASAAIAASAMIAGLSASGLLALILAIDIFQLGVVYRVQAKAAKNEAKINAIHE
jgi:hypothetical protein